MPTNCKSHLEINRYFKLSKISYDGVWNGEVFETLLEANAAMKSIVRTDSGEDWEQYVTRLVAEDGVEIPSKGELIR